MALLTSAGRNNLPDSDFAYIEPGGSKDGSGKTTPRSLRHFPIQDAEHVRDALARIAQGAKFGQLALPKVRAAAKKFGVDVSKSLLAHEVKSFSFKMDAPPDDEGNFTGYAAVFGNVDQGNDVIDPGAVTKTLQENPEVPLFWQHDYNVVPIGVGRLFPDERGKGVRIEGKLFLETSELAREVFGAMKAKAVKGLSIGYTTLKRAFQGKIRRLQEIAIGEVSLCNSPMNPLALVDSVKAEKWLGQYGGASDDVCNVLSAIGSLTDYLASEVAEGDTADVSRIQTVLPILAECLMSEIDDVAAGDDATDAYHGMMSEPIDLAVKKLEALLENDQLERAADNATEPDLSTLRALMADMRSAA